MVRFDESAVGVFILDNETIRKLKAVHSFVANLWTELAAHQRDALIANGSSHTEKCDTYRQGPRMAMDL